MGYSSRGFPVPPLHLYRFVARDPIHYTVVTMVLGTLHHHINLRVEYPSYSSIVQLQLMGVHCVLYRWKSHGSRMTMLLPRCVRFINDNSPNSFPRRCSLGHESGHFSILADEIHQDIGHTHINSEFDQLSIEHVKI